MKKIFTFLLVLVFLTASASALMLGDTVQKGKLSLGASFGTSGASEKSLLKEGDKATLSSGKFGYVGRIRFDAMIADKQSATVMASIESPNKNVLVTSLKEGENVADSLYAKLFIGYTTHSVSSDNLLIAIGIGPEFSYDFKQKEMGAGPATYVRTSYAIGSSNFTFDSTAKGSAMWTFKDFDSIKDAKFFLDGDVSLGFTYYF